MSDNIVQQVASGNAPQPAAESATDSNYDQLQSEMEDAIDDGSEESAEVSVEAQDAAQKIDEAQKAGDLTKAQATELKKKLKLKIDGVEEEVEVDFNNEEDLKKHFQKSRAFDKRVKEFSGYKSQVDQLLELLDKDPEALLEKMGKNVDEMAEKRLARKIEEMKKSPEQQKQEKLEQELEQLRKEKKEAEEKRQTAEKEKMRNEQAQLIQDDIAAAMDSAKTILPKKNPKVIQRIAETMLYAFKNGHTSVTAKEVIPLVEKQWREEQSSVLNDLSEDALEELIGKQNLERLRKKRLASRPKTQTATAKQVAQDTGTKKEVEDSSKPKKNFRDVFRLND